MWDGRKTFFDMWEGAVIFPSQEEAAPAAKRSAFVAARKMRLVWQPCDGARAM